jgi:ABC-type Na+ efflux pump permease subunit
LTVGQIAGFAAQFFWTFSLLQVLMVLVVGPALVAPTISVERERRTIEYLFATDLTNTEIVLGKLLARVLDIAAAVLVGLPILALAGLLGGIDPRQLLFTFIITASTMFTVAALAIAVSVRSTRVRNAVSQVYAILLALLVIPMMAQPVLQYYGYYDWIAPVNDRFIEANPLVTLTHTVLSGFTRLDPWSSIGAMVLNQAIFATVVTAASIWSLRRVQARQGSNARKRRWILARPHRPMIERPVLWKELRENSIWSYGLLGRIAVPIVALLLIWPVAWSFYEEIKQNGWGQYQASRFSQFQEVSSSVLTLVDCIGLLLLGIRAASSITGEREKDTWLSLLSTPLSARDIVGGKILGNLKMAGWLLGYWALVMVLRLVCWPTAWLSIPCSLIVGGILALFCSTLGTYVSLASRTTLRAQGTTMFLLLLLAGGYLFCCAPFMFRAGGGEEFALTLCAPFLLYVSLSAGEFQTLAGPPNREGTLVAVGVIGTIAYAVATGILYAMCESKFDQLNGRVSSAMDEDSFATNPPPMGETQPPAGASLPPANGPGTSLVDVEIVDDSASSPPA